MILPSWLKKVEPDGFKMLAMPTQEEA